MSQYVEDIEGTPLVKAALGTNIESLSAPESKLIDNNTKALLQGRVKAKAEIASGATLLTLPLRHAPKATRIINIFVEPAFRAEITTGGLIKAVGAIPTGKEIMFDGLEYIL